jgi:hypothetical protein
MDEPVACAVCGIEAADLAALASHLAARAEASDGRHVMWLNRNLTKHRTSAADLEPLLAAARRGDEPESHRIRR